LVLTWSDSPLPDAFASARADKWGSPPRAPVSNVANSKFQNVPGRPRGRPRPSIQPFCTARPAQRDVLVDPQPRAERGSATGAGKPGDLARERSRSIPPSSSFGQPRPGTGRAKIADSPRARGGGLRPCLGASETEL